MYYCLFINKQLCTLSEAHEKSMVFSWAPDFMYYSVSVWYEYGFVFVWYEYESVFVLGDAFNILDMLSQFR